ncbi:MAG: MFS transporter [bacterium]|nr:MFS transporter [bacterium]
MTREPDDLTGAASTDAAEQNAGGRWMVLLVALGTMLAPLNSTLIAVALPNVMTEFNVGAAQVTWLVTAYLAAMASLQPLAGKIGDRWGRRHLVLGGLMLFGLASLASALAPTLWVLILLRALQGVAGACIVPNGAALVREALPVERRGRGFGYIETAVGLAAATGPPLGGVIIAIAGWRAIFLVNVVLVLPSLFIGWRILASDPSAAVGQRFDLTGAILLPILIMGGAGWLMSLGRNTTPLALIIGSIVVCVIATLFVRHEYQHPDPVIKPQIFRHRAFAAANASIGLGNLAMYTLLLSVPLLLASRSDAASLQTGFVLLSLSASMVVLAALGGRLADRFGRRLPTVIGLAILALGTLPFALAGTGITLPTLVTGLTLVGMGVGLSTPGLRTTAVEVVPRAEAGVASGVYSTSRYLGSILGSVILSALLGAKQHDVDNLATVFIIVFIAALLAILAGLGLQSQPKPVVYD